MAISETGYRRRTFDEILDAKIAKAKELFGDDINTEENTALGKYIRINAYDQYNVEETAEQIYYSIFPQTASGQSLDRLAWILGMTRNIAEPARYTVKVYGNAGSIVEYGFLVATESGINFYNLGDTEIGADGTCEIRVECVEAGIFGNIAPNDINTIVNPVTTIDKVQGVGLIRIGVDIESDNDFRKRYEIVREGKGSCTAASIISALTNVPTVKGAYIIANESATKSTDDGIPPKAIACYIDGGEDYHQEIAEAIFDKKPIGIGTYGDQSEMVSYGALTDYEVKFSHALRVGIDVKVDLIITNAEIESSCNEEIKTNISAFIDSLTIGKPLITTMLYSQIYSVSGVVSALVQVSVDGETFTTDNIIVNPNECCRLNSMSINEELV